MFRGGRKIFQGLRSRYSKCLNCRWYPAATRGLNGSDDPKNIMWYIMHHASLETEGQVVLAMAWFETTKFSHGACGRFRFRGPAGPVAPHTRGRPFGWMVGFELG